MQNILDAIMFVFDRFCFTQRTFVFRVLVKLEDGGAGRRIAGQAVASTAASVTLSTRSAR